MLSGLFCTTKQVGVCTPRHFSPCSVCLEQKAPVLFAYPERYFTYLQQANLPLVEGLVLPLIAEGQTLGTIWVVTHDEQRQFDAEDVRLMTGLADFTAAALLRNQQQTRDLLAQNVRLTALEERYRVTLEAAELATWDWYSATDCTFWNEQHYRLWGLDPRNGSGNEPETFERFLEFIHPDDRQRVRVAIEQAIAQHTPYRATYRILRADTGELRWMTDAGQVIKGLDGQGVRMLGVMYDSTDQHQAQHALAESERNFRAIANIVPDLLWHSNPDGSTNWYSDRWLEYTGQTFEQAIGWGWINAIHPDDWEESARRYREAVEQGVMLQQEHRIRRHDGAYRWFVVKASPLKDESGKVIKMYGAATDIHNRKQAEDALRESEDKYRALFMSMDEAYAVVEVLTDDNGEWNDFLFLEVNPVFVAQTGMEYPVGRKATELLGTPNPNWARVYGQVAETGEPIRFEEGEATLGRVFDLYVSRVGGEGSRRVAVLFTDITDRKRREANLTFLADLMNDFAPLVTAEEVMEMADERITEHLDLSRYMFVEIFPEAGTCTYLLPSHPPGQLEISGSFVLAEYHTEEEHRLLCAGHSMIVNDIRDGTRTPEQIASFEVFDIGSIINTPYLSNGRWVFDLGVARSKPSVWREDEIELLRELSARVWLRIERARAEEALRRSEGRLRALFESIDEGFSEMQVILNEEGHVVDWLHLALNGNFSRVTGIPDITGRLASEVFPNLEGEWFRRMDLAYRTGEPQRFETELAELGRWFDNYITRLGGEDDNRVFGVFGDITDRKRRERQQDFLLKLNDALRSLYDAVEMQKAAMNLVTEHLGVTRALYFEMDADQNGFTKAAGVETDPVRLPDRLRISDFGDDIAAAYRAGRTVVVRDAEIDSQLESQREAHRAINVRASVGVPLVKNGQLVVVLGVHQPTPRDWTSAEVQLLEEVTDRTWAAVERARAEAALRESEERRQLALEAAEMGTFLWFPQADHPQPDARMLALFGLGEGDVLSLAEALATMIHPDDRDFYAARVATALDPSGNGKLDTEIRVIHPDQSLHWIAVTGQTMFEGEPPQPVRMYGTAADISDRKRREANLAFLAEASQDLADLSSIEATMGEIGAKISAYLNTPLMALAEIDEAEETVTVNHAWNRPDLPSLRGQYRISDFLTEDFRQACRTNQTFVVSDVATDSRVNAESMTALNIAAFISVPLLREGHWQFQLTVYDTTPRQWRADEIDLMQELTTRIWTWLERARAEATLAANLRDTQRLHELSTRLTSEADLQVLYDEIMAAAVDLMQADAGTIQILEAETQDLLFLATQGLDPKTVEYFYRLDAGSNTVCGVALATQQRTLMDYDVPASEDPSGSLQKLVAAGFLCGQSTPLITRSGRPVGMVSTHWHQPHRPSNRQLQFLDLLARQTADFLEQRQAELERRQLLEQEQAARAEAEQANRVKDEFLAILSHELRSPLNPILGWASLLQSKPFSPASAQRALVTIERNAKLQTQLIDDLLDVSRILRGKLSLAETTVNLVTVIEAAMEVVKTAVQAKSIALQFKVSESCLVRGDEGRLQQIVWNLLSNAIKFTPEGGRVDVRLETLNNQAQISVTDTGQGICPDFLPHLFESFRQEDSSVTRRHGGLGLGLAIVKYLVDAHGGTISADSPGVGQGATFILKLPLRQEASPPPAAPVSTDIDLTGLKVLAVDDSEDTRELLAMVLAAYGAEARVAASGTEVLAQLVPFAPDVLVCDIGMPEMDGYALLRQIRALPKAQGGNIPAIAVTAFAREEDRQQAFAKGFQQHVAKPIAPQELASAILQLTMK